MAPLSSRQPMKSFCDRATAILGEHRIEFTNTRCVHFAHFSVMTPILVSLRTQALGPNIDDCLGIAQSGELRTFQPKRTKRTRAPAEGSHLPTGVGITGLHHSHSRHLQQLVQERYICSAWSSSNHLVERRGACPCWTSCEALWCQKTI